MELSNVMAEGTKPQLKGAFFILVSCICGTMEVQLTWVDTELYCTITAGLW